MTIAETHGKLLVTGSEDLLTSDVFTAFRYLPAITGIIGYLRSVSGLANLLPEPQSKATCDYHFWPLGPYREPDLLLELNIDDAIYHVLVEAKYQSGPSDSELAHVDEGSGAIVVGNQLADQFRGLMKGSYVVHDRNGRNRRIGLASVPAKRALLYLTAHPLQPYGDLDRALSIYPEARGRLFWSSWYQVADYVHNKRALFTRFPFNLIIDDLVHLLSKNLFAPYQGVGPPSQIQVGKSAGAFWKDRRAGGVTFAGFRTPPDIRLQTDDRHFWRG